jgi:hypothetical protein
MMEQQYSKVIRLASSFESIFRHNIPLLMKAEKRVPKGERFIILRQER